MTFLYFQVDRASPSASKQLRSISGPSISLLSGGRGTCLWSEVNDVPPTVWHYLHIPVQGSVCSHSCPDHYRGTTRPSETATRNTFVCGYILENYIFHFYCKHTMLHNHLFVLISNQPQMHHLLLSFVHFEQTHTITVPPVLIST